MKPVLSVAIPAHNEARYLGRCISSILASAEDAGQRVEILVALNRCSDNTGDIAQSLGARCVIEDTKCIAAVRNAAVRASRAPVVVTLDADSWMAPGTINAVLRKVSDPRYIGGGSMIKPERYSVGICCSLFLLLPFMLAHPVSAGMFWCRRSVFEAIGGFDEGLLSAEDLDFALRLRAYGKLQGQSYGTVWRQGITTSCRKFDRFGDWHLLRQPGLVKALLGGKDRAAADGYYYDIGRDDLGRDDSRRDDVSDKLTKP